VETIRQMAENKIIDEIAKQESQMSLGQVLGYLWSILVLNARLLVITTFIAIGLAFVAKTITPNRYLASATVMPIASGRSGMSGLLSSLNVGIVSSSSNGIEQMLQLYPQIAKSDKILYKVCGSPFKDGYVASYLSEGIDWDSDSTNEKQKIVNELKNEVQTEANTYLGLFTISYESYDPELSANIVNLILEQMESMFNEKAAEGSAITQALLDKRIARVDVDLYEAESHYLEFRKANRDVSRSPELQMVERRFFREIEIQNALYVELTKQKEMNKLEKPGGGVKINILDRASAPTRPNNSGLMKRALSYVLINIILICTLLVMRDKGVLTWLVLQKDEIIKNIKL
jgi:uncharacterized protein involved in exopolysaccharide biosynthesis